MSGFGFSPELMEKLRQQGRRQPGKEPVLLAKVLTDDGKVLYLIDVHGNAAAEVSVTVFDPDFPLGYPVLPLTHLERSVELCPAFKPQPLSAAYPGWGGGDE